MVSRREQVGSYVILFVFSFLAVWPVLAIILLAFNGPGTLVNGVGLPTNWTLDSFEAAWNGGGVGPALFNSFVVAVSVVAIAVVLSILTGYAFGTMRFRGQSAIFYYFLIGIIVPYEATVIPLYYDFRVLHLTDTYLAMILPQIAFSLSFGTFWMRSFFRGFPGELDRGRARRWRNELEHPVARRPANGRARPARAGGDPLHLDLERTAARDRHDPNAGAPDGPGFPCVLRRAAAQPKIARSRRCRGPRRSPGRRCLCAPPASIYRGGGRGCSGRLNRSPLGLVEAR